MWTISLEVYVLMLCAHTDGILRFVFLSSLRAFKCYTFFVLIFFPGAEIVKPYTPVSDSLLSDFKEPVLSPNKYIYFLIKIYPAGLFTPELDRLQIGDFISVSGPEGNFKVSKLQEVEDLFLLAAGTGFTPMVTVLNYALSHMSSLRYVPLFLVTVIGEVFSTGHPSYMGSSLRLSAFSWCPTVCPSTSSPTQNVVL